jgi:folate-binding Fe-S cluster repair protein YgfZ
VSAILSFGALADRSASLSSSHEEVSTEDYHLHRMQLGLPEGPSEIVPGSALPLESSMDIHGGGTSLQKSRSDQQSISVKGAT